jgi:SSS family solute:Na+ symporter
VLLGACTAWFNSWALLLGWAAGTLVGTAMAVAAHLTPAYPLVLAGYTFPGYTAFYTLLLNLALTIVLTLIFNAIGARRASPDETLASDYQA